MKKTTIDYFASLDMILMNFYGLSETTGGTTVMSSKRRTIKHAGFIINGVEFKADNPDENGNGEICVRGRNIMMGYLNNEKATREVIDAEGYFHSGDLGKLTDDGFL